MTTKSFSDNSQDKETENKLLLFALDNAPDSVLRTDVDTGKILYANNIACESLGYSREEILNLRISDIDLEIPQEKWPDIVKLLKSGNLKAFDSRLITKDRHIFPVEVTSKYFEYEGSGWLFGFFKDITERRQMQNQLIMQEKMASLGNLVAGIAHEVNNPIGAVYSAADVLKICRNQIVNVIQTSDTVQAIQENRKIQKALNILKDNIQIILIGSERITKLVKGLKNFARLDEAEFKKADIHEGIENTLMLVEHELKNKVEVIKEYGDIPNIKCFPNQLNQVIMYLLINAAHAIEEKGIIWIKTFARDNYVYIKISDTGKGIPPEDLNRIFDPGFTTKGVGVGTGLGLSISYNILKKHKGTITAESKVGGGMEFTLEIPINEK